MTQQQKIVTLAFQPLAIFALVLLAILSLEPPARDYVSLGLAAIGLLMIHITEVALITKTNVYIIPDPSSEDHSA